MYLTILINASPVKENVVRQEKLLVINQYLLNKEFVVSNCFCRYSNTTRWLIMNNKSDTLPCLI